jgi:hypothetical protein
VEGNKRLFRELARDEARKKTSLTRLQTLKLLHKLEQAMNLEKDLGNLRSLVSLWDEEKDSPWQPFYRGAMGWLAGQG